MFPCMWRTIPKWRKIGITKSCRRPIAIFLLMLLLIFFETTRTISFLIACNSCYLKRRSNANEREANNAAASVWWRHQMETFSALLAICAGNSPGTGEFSHKGQWRGALMFALICARINGWVNNREAGDLGRYRGHYDVTVMVNVEISIHPMFQSFMK